MDFEAGYIGLTDPDWYSFLRSTPNLENWTLETYPIFIQAQNLDDGTKSACDAGRLFFNSLPEHW